MSESKKLMRPQSSYPLSQTIHSEEDQLEKMQEALEIRAKANVELSSFEQYLKDKLKDEMQKRDKVHKHQPAQNEPQQYFFHNKGRVQSGKQGSGVFTKSTIDTQEGEYRRLSSTADIEKKQKVFENVQRDIRLFREGVNQPSHEVVLLKDEYHSLPNSTHKFRQITNSSQCSNVHQDSLKTVEVHDALQTPLSHIFKEKQELELKQLRKQFNLGYYYDQWLNEKKIRLNSQISAYVNSISKLDNEEKEIEQKLLKDHHFLTLDKRTHVERIKSANSAAARRRRLLPSQTTQQVNKQKQQQSPSKRRNPIVSQREIPSPDKIIQIKTKSNQKSPHKNLSKEKKDTSKDQKRPSLAVPIPVPTNWQTFMRKKSIHSRGSILSPMSQQSGIAVLDQKSDITLFDNFVYSSPFPNWLLQNHKYFELKNSEKYDMDKKIISVSKKESFNRSEFEKHVVALFLQKISLFKMMPFHMLEVIASQLTYLYVSQGNYICRQGDKGDCMYIIFTGQVEIIINGFLIKKIFCGGELVGRTALETDKPRNADMRAKLPCHLLVLSRIDYQQCLNVNSNICYQPNHYFYQKALVNEKNNIFSFINSHPFFRNFRTDKIERMCEEIRARFLAPKECLYQDKDLIDNFYVIKNGHLIKTIQVDLEKQNRWPMKREDGEVYWEVHSQVKKVTYTIDFKTSDIVGYFDIISGRDQEYRTETIDSVSDTFVLYINKNIFKLIFDEDDMLLFEEYHRKKYPTSEKSLIQKVQLEEKQMKDDIRAFEESIRLHLQSCDPQEMYKNEKRLNTYIKKNKDDKMKNMKSKLPFELKPPAISYQTKQF